MTRKALFRRSVSEYDWLLIYDEKCISFHYWTAKIA